MTPLPVLEDLRGGDKRLIARALAAIEAHAEADATVALLDEACAAPRAYVVGLTGPPGVGKSTLINQLIVRARGRGETVGVLAVDPSSRRSGGALLADRARIATDPTDRGVYVRSMAARDRLGGLADQTVAAMVLMRAIYDRVMVESVGIGQSECDISFVSDTLVLCVQPSSGDSLQFMKAGVTELPDIIAVTKADLGEPAQRARSELDLALRFSGESDFRRSVVLVAAGQRVGLEDLETAIGAHRRWLADNDRLGRKREDQQTAWVDDTVRSRFGTVGLAAARHLTIRAAGPFTTERAISQELATRLLP
jgi:LAO/AO transport system kinase